MKLECIHAATCLPDYWSGHHLAHVQIPVWKGMDLDDIKSSLKAELDVNAVAGSDDIAQLLSDAPIPDHLPAGADDDAYEAARAAINAIQPLDPAQTTFFNDLEEEPEDPSGFEDAATVYAFFVFREEDQ